MPASPRKITPQRRTLYSVCIGLLLLGALLCLALLFFLPEKNKPAAITGETPQTEEHITEQQPGTTFQSESTDITGQPHEMDEGKIPASDTDRCMNLDRELSSFFAYLDEQPYIREYQFKQGIQSHFKQILKKLFSSPPTMTVAESDLLGRLKNIAHFYRILGAKDILLAKNYLANEQGRLEHDLNLFYQWLLLGSCKQEHVQDLSLPLPSLYEYAAYFLTSPGGKAYLFRRTEDTAVVVEYYCILIVDLANKAELNRYHIDLRPLITASLAHMEQNTSLQDRSEYLHTLQNLATEYARQ